MRTSSPRLGQLAQALDGVEGPVALLGQGVAMRVGQHVAALGHQQEQQPVHQAQELAVVVLLVEPTRSQAFPQGSVGRMGQEAGAQ